jgi:aminoglycoside N3'-acetyltransferase
MTEAKNNALVQVLRQLGLEKSDILMVHSNVSRLLKLPLQTNRRLQFLQLPLLRRQVL